ncbi:MAG TPA: dihydroorotase [Dehalococcoidia bacterium]|jgi:dihydroorotase|nr:dihydroorotase [Dehalococcoidia bacterium]
MKDGLLIKDGRIIDPSQGIDEIGSLLVGDGKISWRGETPPEGDYDVLHAEGLIVCPGFIDFHCHLRQPGFEEKETIATGTRAAARGGFTTVCCMPNTNPPLDNEVVIAEVKAKAASEGCVRVLPIGCISRGRKGEELVEMEELASAGVVAYSDDGEPVGSSRLMLQALARSRTLGLPIIDHCEEVTLKEGGQMNEGALAVKLGLRGIPAAAEEVMVARDLVLAQLAGGHLHIAHVSTAGSVELIRHAKERGVSVTAEVTPHHLTLTEEVVNDYNTNAKVSPPLRTKEDNEALIQGLKENVIDIIATDHAPHTEADKQCQFARAAFGISGLETALGSLMSLVHSEKLPLITLIAKLTCEPAKLLKNSHLGTLKIGAPADITIFDLYEDWVVRPETFASKGRNTPLTGSVLKGRVMATICGGKLVHKDGSIRLEASSGQNTASK